MRQPTLTGATEPKHPIQVVARRTGLSADVLRVWERRYGAVEPGRSTTNRRLYSDADIERLRLLRRATTGGRRIGDVCGLSDEELTALVAEDEAAVASVEPRIARPGPTGPTGNAKAHMRGALEAVERLDGSAVERSIAAAAVELSPPVLVDAVLVPLLHEVGARWRDGSLRVAHEHLLTASIRSFLGGMVERSCDFQGAPEIVVTTPSGQLHELGAIMVAVTAAFEGWRPTYLGPNLSAEEIALAAQRRSARAVALSVVYPADDPQIASELRKLRRLLEPDTRIIIGGGASRAYEAVVHEALAVRLDGLGELRNHLESLRAS